MLFAYLKGHLDRHPYCNELNKYFVFLAQERNSFEKELLGTVLDK